MRITFQMQHRDASAAMERAAERLNDAQRVTSSGRRMSRISDDPTAAATAVAERSHVAQTDQYTRTANSVGSRLSVVDTVLSGVIERITAARSAAMSARGSSKTAAQRESAARQLEGLRDALADDFNSTFQGAYVFGGTNVTVRPFQVPGGSTVPVYNGNNTTSRVDVGDGREVTIAFDGESITQGSDAQDLFQTLDALITAVAAGDDDGIGAGIDGLQRVFDRATSAQTRLGNDMQVIDAQKLRLQQLKLSGAERLAKLEDADMAAAITEMSHADAAYRATLGAIGTVSRVSLLDYLK